jgi:hypothetical protein
MLTRRVSVALLLILAVAGCAAPEQAGASSKPSSPSSPDVIDLPLPSSKPGAGKPATGATQTINGTVTFGVEPNCLLLTSGGSSYLLIFKDQAMRSDAPVGKAVTLVGHSEPSMMTTCMQGVPFVVTSVSGG